MLDPGDDTRQRILEAAGPIFAEKGLEAASVREICERAGANVSAVNYHFRSKRQLYIETVRHAYQSAAAAVPFPEWAPGTPPERRLREFIGAMMRRVVEDRPPEWHRTLVMREVAEPTEACKAFVEEFVRPSADVMLAILDDLLPAGVPEAKRRLIGASVIGQCLHYHHCRHVMPLLWGEEYRRLDLDRVADHIAAFTLAALRGLSGSPEGG
jgi:AcrR family transcriptional regulator